MDVSERDRNNKDLLLFARENKEKFTGVAEQEVLRLDGAKVSFALEVNFSRERDGKRQEIKHFFRDKDNQPNLFIKPDKEEIEQKFDEFIDNVKGEIENWSEKGSGWETDGITIGYVDVENYKPVGGGTYLPLPANLAKKKAIINVRNRDNECLKWALRAALFTVTNGKNPNRPSSYPVNDGINYIGIEFPTPLKHIDKLEAQNANLAINVFGWENGCVTVHRISKKEAKLSRINLMLIESGGIQHYCCVKRVSALLFDQTKHRNAKNYCLMCLTGFSRADLLESHKNYCNGVNGRPTRIEMPEKGKNVLSFKNYQKQMKVPYVIYADFEAILRKIKGCERGPEREHKSYTERIERHEACGYAYMVVRSDGEVTGSKVYGGKTRWERF